MRYAVIPTEQSVGDLRAVEAYLSQGGVATLKKFGASLQKALDNLETMPYIAPPFYAKFRKMVLPYDHVLIYSVNDETKTVTLRRILSSRRDIGKIFRTEGRHGRKK